MGLKIVKSHSMGDKEIAVYTFEEVLKKDPFISMIYGERSDGKTYAGAELILNDYLENGKKGIWVRRRPGVFKRDEIKNMFEPLIANGALCSTGWEGIEFINGAWFLYRFDPKLNKNIYDQNAFCITLAVSQALSMKGGQFVGFHYVVFDEFLTRNEAELEDEAVLWAHIISSTARYDNYLRFIMLGNTVNLDSPYFRAFKINARKIAQGTITYMKSEKGRYMAVEYVEHHEGGKDSDEYFDFFKDPKIKSIVEGSWESAFYPELPIEVYDRNIFGEFFIIWETEIIKVQLIGAPEKNLYFLYLSSHEEALDEDGDLIYSPELSAKWNWRQNLMKDERVSELVMSLILNNKMYYDKAETGEVFRNYLKYCRTYSIIKS